MEKQTRYLRSLLQETEDCFFFETDVFDIDYVKESDHLTESEELCDEINDDSEPVIVIEKISGNFYLFDFFFSFLQFVCFYFCIERPCYICKDKKYLVHAPSPYKYMDEKT
jgi:hypothetical protein